MSVRRTLIMSFWQICLIIYMSVGQKLLLSMIVPKKMRKKCNNIL